LEVLYLISLLRKLATSKWHNIFFLNVTKSVANVYQIQRKYDLVFCELLTINLSHLRCTFVARYAWGVWYFLNCLLIHIYISSRNYITIIFYAICLYNNINGLELAHDVWHWIEMYGSFSRKKNTSTQLEKSNMWFDQKHLWSDVLLCNINFAPMFSIAVIFMGIYVSMLSKPQPRAFIDIMVWCTACKIIICLGIWV